MRKGQTGARWLNWYPAGSIRAKLFILLIAAMLVPTLLVSTISQYYMLNAGAKHSTDQSSQILRYVTNELDKRLLSIEQQLNGIVLDPEFQKYISIPKDNIRAQAAAQISFRSIIEAILRANPDAVGFLYLDRVGKSYFESVRDISIQIDYPFEEHPVYKQVSEMRQTLLLPPHEQSYTLLRQREVYSLVRPVYHYQTNTIGAWIIIELDVNSLQEIIHSVELGPSGTMLLYESSTGEALTPWPIAEEMQVELAQHMDAEETEQGGAFLLKSGGVSYQAVYESVRYSDWQLIGLLPLDELMRGSRQTQKLTWMIAAAALLCAALIAFPIMGSVLRPLHRLKAGMANLSIGKYVTIPHTQKDEFGFLIQTYNKMLVDLKTMENEVYISKLNEKEKELLQLQAQINPHFFFNTLETIESYVETEDSRAVGEIIQSVSRMMRYNVRNDGGWAPLAEELNYVQDLLSVHRYRNDQAVQAEIAVDAELRAVPVMKLSIQPFVENALKYGWIPGNLQFRIHLTIQRMNDAMSIRIEDNGQGMSEQSQKLLRELLQASGELKHTFFERHTGIRNVYRRLQLVYGQRFSMRLSSVQGKGTVVEMQIPLTDEGTVRL